MDGWPPSWRSLSWFALARDVAGEAIRWAWEKAYRHDPRRKYP